MVSPGLASNRWYGSYGVDSKPLARVSWFGPENQQVQFGDLAHKITTTVSWFGPQNEGQRFGDLDLKITVMVSMFGPKNQVGGGLSVCT
jgi:hypothetical protein